MPGNIEDVTLNVGLDITDADKSLKEFEARFGHTMSNAQRNVTKLFGEFAKNDKTLEKLNDRASALQKSISLMSTMNPSAIAIGSGKKGELKTFGELVNEAKAELKEVEREIDIVSNKGNNMLSQLGDLIAELPTNERQIFSSLLEQLDDVGALSEDTKRKLNELSAEEERASKTQLQSVLSQLGGMFTRLGQSILRARNALVSFIKNLAVGTLRAFTNTLKKLSSLFSKTGKHSDNLGKSLLKGTGLIKKFILAGIGVRSIYFLFRKFWNMVKEGIKTLAQVDDETNASISGIQTSLNGLQNQFGALAGVVINQFASSISYVINLLKQAIELATMFIAALTGHSTYKKAIAQEQDYAKSLDKTGKSAKEAKRYLSGLDEIRQYDDKKNGSGSGDLSGAFKDVEVELPNWLQKLKDDINLKDWFSLGYDLAEAIADALDKIPWGQIQTKAHVMGQRLAEILNGVFANLHLAVSLGTTLAEAFNTAIDFLKGFILNFDWKQLGVWLITAIQSALESIDYNDFYTVAVKLGQGIAKSINGFFERFKPSDWSQAISTFINSIIASFLAWIQETDWSVIGNKIAVTIKDTLYKINWTEAGMALGEVWNALKEVFGKIITTISWDEDIKPKLKEFFTALFDDIGADINVDSLLSLFEKIGKIISNAFSVFDGISTDDINSLLDTLNKVADVLLEIDWKTLLADIKFIVIELTLLGTTFKVIGTGLSVFVKLSRVVEILHSSIGAVVTTIGGWALIITGVITAFASFFSMLADGFSWLKEIFMVIGIALAAVGAVILGAPALVAAVIAGIVALVATLIIVVKDNWNAIVSFLKSAWAGFKSGVSTALNAIKTIWTTAWTAVKTTVVSIFNSMWSGIKGIINTILGGVEKMVNGVIKALNKMIDAFNKLNFDVPDWVPVVGGKSFSLGLKEISTVSIPKLATGAVIPAGAPFMAMLGDQKNGRNLEAPESLIREIIREEVGTRRSGGEYRFTAQLNRRTLFDEMIAEAKLRQTMTGINPLASI